MKYHSGELRMAYVRRQWILPIIAIVDGSSPDREPSIPVWCESEDVRSYPSSKMDQFCPSVEFLNLAESSSFTYKIGIMTMS